MYNVGETVENFSLPDQNEKLINLSDYKGKWIILYFYPKDNTPGCTNEACDFTDNMLEFKEMNAIIIGISADNSLSHQKFINDHCLKIILLSDLTKEVIKKFGAWGEKELYGKKILGIIRSTFIISPEFKIVQKWNSVKVRIKNEASETKHADVVKSVLKKLQQT